MIIYGLWIVCNGKAFFLMDDVGEPISGRSIDNQHYYMLFEYLDYLDNECIYIYIYTYCSVFSSRN